MLLAASIVLIPGPTNMFVLAQGLTSEKRRVAIALAGIATAEVVWVSVCALGVSGTTTLTRTNCSPSTTKRKGNLYRINPQEIFLTALNHLPLLATFPSFLRHLLLVC